MNLKFYIFPSLTTLAEKINTCCNLIRTLTVLLSKFFNQYTFMKKVFISFAIIIVCLSAKSQLANHKFDGTIQIENQVTPITLDFKKDSVNAVIAQTGEMLEQMIYTVNNDVVTLQKVSGKSDCDTDIVGRYKFTIKGDEITLLLIEDICEARAGVLDQSTWKKVKK